jgi:hypothetical protein
MLFGDIKYSKIRNPTGNQNVKKHFFKRVCTHINLENIGSNNHKVIVYM